MKVTTEETLYIKNMVLVLLLARQQPYLVCGASPMMVIFDSMIVETLAMRDGLIFAIFYFLIYKLKNPKIFYLLFSFIYLSLSDLTNNPQV